MDYRIGNCSSCGAVYKVPASFAHNTAKCKECGGAVQIGEVQSAEAPPAPKKAPVVNKPVARKPAPKPVVKKPAVKKPAPKPAAAKSAAPKPPAAPKPKAPPVPAETREETPAKAKKRSGPSMKEQLLARRAAEAAEAAPATAKKVVRKSAAAATGAAAAAARPSSRPSAARKSSAGSKSSTARKSSSGSSSRRSKSGGGKATRERGRKPEKKKSAMPALLGIVGLLGVGGGAAWVFREDLGLVEASVQAAETPAAVDSTTEGVLTDAANTLTEGLGDAKAAVENAAEGTAEAAKEAAAAVPEMAQKAASAVEDAVESAVADVTTGSEDPPKKEDEPAEVEADDPNDPVLDMQTLPVYERAPGTTDEEWEQLQGWAKTMLDLDSGAASTRSARYLAGAGRKAFPVLMNSVRDLDLKTKEGRDLGAMIQKSFETICNGINYSWRYEDGVKDAKFNAKVMRKWSAEWDKAQSDIEYWIRMAKLDAKDPDKAKALREEFGVETPEDEDDLDEGLFDDL